MCIRDSLHPAAVQRLEAVAEHVPALHTQDLEVLSHVSVRVVLASHWELAEHKHLPPVQVSPVAHSALVPHLQVPLSHLSERVASHSAEEPHLHVPLVQVFAKTPQSVDATVHLQTPDVQTPLPIQAAPVPHLHVPLMRDKG